MVDTRRDDAQRCSGEDVSVVTLTWLVRLQGGGVSKYSITIINQMVKSRNVTIFPTFPKPVKVGNGEPEAKTALPSVWT